MPASGRPAGVRLRFDFAGPDGRVEPRVFTDPVRVVAAHAADEVGDAMAAVEAGLAAGLHAAGFVSYEAAPAFDPSLVAHPPSVVPLVWFGLFEAPEAAAGSDSTPGGGLMAAENAAAEAAWEPSIAPAEYAAGVAHVRDAIARGDAYQVNYTYRLTAPVRAEEVAALYAALIRSHAPPYAALLELERWRILSLSPELFFRRDADLVVTRPMKGTAPRGRWPEEDAARAAALAASAKDRAENVMIVDLARNDLSRVSEVGSVRASHICEIERYPSVFQMVSTVEGRLRPDGTLTGIFSALFPAGSITGAPKTSSMRVIRDIEREPRGVYCGAIGWAAPGGRAVFNVAIRTMTVDAGEGAAAGAGANRAVFGVGGGITWDSSAAGEHAETVAKTACLVPEPSFELLETMRVERGIAVRLERHLARLSASAAFLGFRIDEAVIRAAIAGHLRPGAAPAGEPDAAARRLRLRLSRDGRVSVESRPFAAGADDPQPIVLAPAPVRREDRFLCHKTTRRDVYEQAAAAAPGAFDVLLWNESGELTEFTRGNLVAEIDGARLTPPRECGLLAGVFRAVLLDAGVIREQVIPRESLARATRLWFVNSLREWVPVRLEPQPYGIGSTNTWSTKHQPQFSSGS